MSNRPKGMSAREVWAQQTGKPKEQYPGSSKSSGSSTTVKAPTVNTKQLESLQKAYLGSLAPTSGETEAQTQLGNVITSKELGIAKAEQDQKINEVAGNQKMQLQEQQFQMKEKQIKQKGEVSDAQTKAKKRKVKQISDTEYEVSESD